MCQMSQDDIRDLRADIKDLTKAVSELATEVALLKRDKAWARWVIGIISSGTTLLISTYLNKG